MARAQRQTIDKVFILLGTVTMVVLIAFGGLALWGYHFASNSVKTELFSQQITFPPKGSPALASPEIGPYLNQYAGQQLLNGAQAKAYADHFIAVHLKEAAGGQTYSQVSTASLADPSNQKLAAEKNVLFQGETLRGLLLNAYAFWTFGNLALYAAIASFAGAAVMALLVLAGLAHLRRSR